ncbi:MAG: hypothetical protein KF789_07500 [Bdellovibrionaceae bacterium]|nr:hypothetical protein [Pseudobdellovibrionaceae bacterium]
MEQAMNFQAMPLQDRNVVKTAKNTLSIVWRWIRWFLGEIVTAMFVPSPTDRRIEESRERTRQLLARSY